MSPYALTLLLEIVADGLIAVDWLQTLDIVRRYEAGEKHWYERNPFLGKHPTRGEVNTYFTALFVTKFSLTHLFPQHQNKFNLYVCIVWPGAVDHNFKIGLRARF